MSTTPVPLTLDSGFSLLTASIQHRRDMQQLRTSFGAPLPRSTAGLVAALFSLLGIGALLVVLLGH